jgi:hypothetical protein
MQSGNSIVESKGFWRRCLTALLGSQECVHRLELKTTIKHVSKTGSVSVFSWREGDTSNGWGQLCLRNAVGSASPSPHLKTETDPLSESLSFLVFRIANAGQSPQTRWFSIDRRVWCSLYVAPCLRNHSKQNWNCNVQNAVFVMLKFRRSRYKRMVLLLTISHISHRVVRN